MVKMQEQDTGWRVEGGAAELRQGEGYRARSFDRARALQATPGHSGAVLGRGARGVNY